MDRKSFALSVKFCHPSCLQNAVSQWQSPLICVLLYALHSVSKTQTIAPSAAPLLLQPHINKYSLIPNSSFRNLLLFRCSFCFQLLLCFTLGLSARSLPCAPYNQLLIHLVCLLTKVLVNASWDVSKWDTRIDGKSLKIKECAVKYCLFLWKHLT